MAKHSIYRYLSFVSLSLILLSLGYLLGTLQSEPQKTFSRKPSPSVTTLTREPFHQLILSASSHHVLEFDQNNRIDTYLLNSLEKATNRAVDKLNAPSSPTIGLRRINEASSFFEELLNTYLNETKDIQCTIPLNSEGKAQRTGYPDLLITHTPSGRKYYLDPKLYEEASRRSSLRSFYYSPESREGKIHHEACHLLLGISHDGKDGEWKFTGWNLIDLYHLPLNLKLEYNSSNRIMYSGDHLIKNSNRS